MTPQIMRILKKLYHFDNRYFNERDEPCFSENTLSEKERALLHDHGWIVNDIVCFSGHAEVINRLRSLKEDSRLTKKRCLDAFVAGVGGSYPRGRSAWPAWHYLEHCPPPSLL